jgi:HlyD family secretion protein
VAKWPWRKAIGCSGARSWYRWRTSVLSDQRNAADANVQEAEAALRVARQDLVRSEELSRGQIAARQTLEQREAAARQAEARLAAARARRDEAVARLAQTRVVAPTDGTVSRRTALLGAVAPAGPGDGPPDPG